MKRSRRDLSGGKRLPPIPKQDLIFYHWSPTFNRLSINKIGLTVNKPSLQGIWRPPYVCFSDDPKLAWQLSGEMYPDIKSWDLWMCFTPTQTSFDHYEILTDTYVDTGRKYVKEYRVYTRVYKRDLTYLATREN
jgi:hypothetical protein